MARVVLEQVSKAFRGATGEPVQAVRDLSLTVEDGEFMVLVGPSGCGKSTLLRLIAGLEVPTRGTLRLDDRVINDVPPSDRDVAMVFQHYALYPHLTVYDNLAFGLKLRRTPHAELDRRVRASAATLGLVACLQRLPQALSGGERQRVALGRALVRQPAVFLFDEPLSNLDATLRLQMRLELVRLQARLGTTVLHVTHDQAEALTLGQRVAVLCGGAIQQVADPLTLYRQPANLFVAGFIGSPPMNLWRGRVRAEGHAWWFEAEVAPGAAAAARAGPEAPVPLALPASLADPLASLPGRAIVLGFRAEDVHLAAPDAQAHDGSVLSARVELAELLGAETILHLTAAGRPFAARVPSSERRPVGTTVRVRLDLARAQLFDAASERALSRTL